jgi:O-acetyl-ADP-ribose deacetylase (regulator of RNase III)
MLRSRLTLSFGRSLELALLVGEGAPEGSQALVEPQDVNLILGDVGVVDASNVDPQEGARQTSDEPARRPGSIVVTARRARPVRMQAVVYDFARTPHAREADVFEALLACFEEARSRGLESMALQPVGTAHLGVEPETFMRLLLHACYGSAELGTTLRHISLVLPSREELKRYETLLRALVGERATAEKG